MSKQNLRNLINFELKHNFWKEFLTKKEIKETINKLYNEWFIIIQNKTAIPVYIWCESYKLLDILNGNWLAQDLWDLYREWEAEKVEFTICTINYESWETQYWSWYWNIYHIPWSHRLEDKIEWKIKEVILSALQIG